MKRLVKILTAITSVTGLAGIATLAWGYTECSKFELKDITVPLLEPGVLRGAREFKILHISDIHMVPYQTEKQAWIKSLIHTDPDLVINTGDNLSDEKGVPALLQALDPLLRRPGVFVFGSNDYFAPKPVNPFLYLFKKKRKVSKVELPWKSMRAAFLEHGWHDANNKRVEFRTKHVRLAIAGVDDPHHDLDDYAAIAGPPHPDSDFALALLHAPEPRVLKQFAADGYQLSLSGHTHGGQICLPGSRAIVTNSGINRARAQGLHHFENMLMYVSNGLGTSKFAPVRIFCRPSATLIRVVEKPTS